MPTSIALGLIIANFVPLFFVFYNLSADQDDKANTVATGVVGGVPLRTEYRWVVLHSHWVPRVLGCMICGLFATLLNLTIADYATDAGIKTVAHLAAFITGGGGVGVGLLAIPEYLHYRSILRQAEAD